MTIQFYVLDSLVTVKHVESFECLDGNRLEIRTYGNEPTITHSVTSSVDVLAETTCEWFARCENPATTTTHHPILGDVPTCERCHKFATEG